MEKTKDDVNDRKRKTEGSGSCDNTSDGVLDDKMQM